MIKEHIVIRITTFVVNETLCNLLRNKKQESNYL